MKIHDISQEVFTCVVYPGDMAPKKIEDKRMSRGDSYNGTNFEMCAHNGTHVDAPFHFVQDGVTIEQMALEKTVGLCTVLACTGGVTASMAAELIAAAKRMNPEAARRILLKGGAFILPDGAEVFAAEETDLIGVEPQSAAPADAPAQVHRILLRAGIALLEGIRLTAVPEGVYLLSAAPIALGGSDGAPCRAILLEM